MQKKTLFAGIALIVFINTSLAQHINLDSGLVAYYPFNGNANDESGNENHLTQLGEVNFNERFVELTPSEDSFKINGFSSPTEPNSIGYTIAFTMSMSSPHLHNTIAAINTGQDWFGSKFWVFNSALNPRMILFQEKQDLRTNGYGHQVPHSETFLSMDTIIKDQPIFYAYTYGQDTVRIYRNNIIQGVFPNVEPYKPIGANMVIGSNPVEGNVSFNHQYPFHGSLDEFYIYNRGLDSSEVGALFETSKVAVENLELTHSTIAENLPIRTFIGLLKKTDLVPSENNIYSIDHSKNDNSLFTISQDSIFSNVVFDFEIKSQYLISVEVINELNETFEKQLFITILDVAEVDLDSGLVAYYPFNGNANDESGNGHHAILNGASSDIGTFNEVNTALRFDGVNDHVIFPNEIRFRPNSSHALSLWLRTSQIDRYDIISQRINGPADPSSINFGVIINKNFQGSIEFADPGYNVGSNISTSYNLSTDLWNHLAFVKNIERKELSIWINGVLISKEPLKDADFQIQGQLYFGTDPNRVLHYSGLVDNVRFYNRALEQEEIERISSVDGNLNRPLNDIFFSTYSVTEDTPVGSSLLQLKTTVHNASGNHTYQLVNDQGENNNDFFRIDKDSLFLIKKLDYETHSIMSLRVEVNDGINGAYRKTLNLKVEDVFEGENISLDDDLIAYYSFDEGNPVDDSGNGFNGTVIGVASLTEGYDQKVNAAYQFDGINDYISIDGTNSHTHPLSKLNKMSLTFWMKPASTNQIGGIISKLESNQQDEGGFRILYNTLNQRRIMFSVLQRASQGTSVYSKKQLNLDEWVFVVCTYDINQLKIHINGGFDQSVELNRSILPNDNNLTFGAEIFGSTRRYFQGALDDIRLYNRELKNYEIKRLYYESQSLDATISNSSIPENSQIGSFVGVFSSTDPQKKFSFSLTNQTQEQDNSSFRISGDSLFTNATLDYESKNTYQIEILANDGNQGTFERQFTIKITDVNEASTNLTLTSDSIFENQPSGQFIGTLETTDPDKNQSFTYQLTSGTGDTDNSNFTINGNSLLSNASFDFETKSQHSIRVMVDDGQGGKGTFEKQFTIKITDVNEAPTNLTLTSDNIFENQPSGQFIGTLKTTDPDKNQSFNYQLTSGTGDMDNSNFTIIGDSLLSDVTFDFETKSQYSIRVRTNDQNELGIEKTFSISVLDVYDVPLDFWLSNGHLLVGSKAYTRFGCFRSNYKNISYQIVNEKFTIKEGCLECTKDVLNSDKFSISVKATNHAEERIKDFEVIAVAKPLNTVTVEGRDVFSYRILGLPTRAIPLNRGILGLIESEHKKIWRVFKWDDNESVELSYRDTLRAGKGYWIASDKPVSADLTEGSPVQLNDRGYFDLKLNKGWNLIGNPFYTVMDWTATLTHNIERGVVQKGDLEEILYVFRRAYQARTNLELFEGAFLNSKKDVTLELVGNDNNASSRKAPGLSYYKDDHHWQLTFYLQDETTFFNVSGIGVKQGYSTSKDQGDLELPPSPGNGEILSMTEASSGLAKNLIGPESGYAWEFDVNGTGKLNLSWRDQARLIHNNLKLVLLPQQELIDMKSLQEISFTKLANQRILILYKNPEVSLPIQARSYPNPSHGELVIESLVLGTKSTYTVTVRLFQINGTIYKKLQKEALAGSVVSFRFSTTDDLSLVPGVYIYSVEYNNQTSKPERLVIQK